jgi:hypothetical protein
MTLNHKWILVFMAATMLGSMIGNALAYRAHNASAARREAAAAETEDIIDQIEQDLVDANIQLRASIIRCQDVCRANEGGQP